MAVQDPGPLVLFIQDTAPDGDHVVVGCLWSDTSSGAQVLNRCTALGPITFASTETGGAPTDADYLVGTAQGGLSAEIVVGTTPGGELGGSWASPTVDVTHAGSAHHAESHTLVSHSARAHADLSDAPADAHHAQAHTLVSHSARAHSDLSDAPASAHHTKYTDAEALAATQDDATSDPLPVGDVAADGSEESNARKDHVHVQGGTAGGELAGSYPNPTVDATHSGSAHHAKYTDAEAIAAVEGEATLALAGDVVVAGDKTLSTDVINETDPGAGVTIDGVLLKDGAIDGDDVPSTHAGSAHHLASDAGPPNGVASGELGGSYPSPTVDATHSGSAHHAELVQANQAAVEAETNQNTYVPPDLINFHPGVAKAACKWEQTGAHSIIVSRNWTSVTDGGGAGSTDHVIGTDFSSADFFGGFLTRDRSTIGYTGTINAGDFTTVTRLNNDTSADNNDNSLVLFGDQA